MYGDVDERSSTYEKEMEIKRGFLISLFYIHLDKCTNVECLCKQSKSIKKF